MSIKSFALALLLCASATFGAEFKITSSPFAWQQVEKKLSFHLFSERERYTPLDRSVRFVMATEAAVAGHALEDLAARWMLTRDGQVIARGTESLNEGGVDVRFAISQLTLGDYNLAAQLIKGDAVLAEQSQPLRYEYAAAPATTGRIELRLPRGMPLHNQTWPVQAGVPFPKGALWDADSVAVVDAAGQPVDAGVVVRSRWGNDPSASIRWLGVDFQPGAHEAQWPNTENASYFLMFTPGQNRPAPRNTINAIQDGEGITLDTGAATMRINRHGFNVIDQWQVRGGPSYQSSREHGLYLVDHEGTIYRSVNDADVELSIEEQTDIRIVIRAAGWYVKDNAASPPTQDYKLPTDKLCRFITRIEAYAGKPYARVMNTLILTHDTFNVKLIDAGMSLPIPGGTAKRATFGIEDANPTTQQVAAAGVRGVQHLHDAFVVEDGNNNALLETRRSAGWAMAHSNNASIAITLRDLWQRYPKELEVLPNAIKLHVWPAHGKDHPQINQVAHSQFHKLLYAHQGKELTLNAPWDYFLAAVNFYDNDDYGVYKPASHAVAAVTATAMGVATTSDVMVQLGEPNDTEQLVTRADCFLLAPHAVADPKWACDSLAFGYSHPYDPKTFPKIEALTSDLMRGYWNNQEWAEMYGMWIYRSWLHSNYQEDEGGWSVYRLYNGTHHHEAPIPWLLYARSGDPFYLTQGMANIRQLTDVQMIHHADPRYNHKEFHAHQKRIVGSTKHDNSISPWGNDHAILGHLCAYNGAILAYYMTGDLRLREVVVDEWQNTLLTERDSRDYLEADRSNTAYPQLPRDNATAVGEIIDLYQLTYDPRLLALLAPRMDIWLNEPDCMGVDWGQPMHNVMLFHGSAQANQQLIEGAEALLKHEPRKPNSAKPLHAARELMALASILKPDRNYAAQALSFDNYSYITGYAWNQLHHKIFHMHCPAGEYTLYMPRVMYALANCTKSDVAPIIGAGMTAPREPGTPTRVIVREDTDRAFKVYVNGHVAQESGFDVRVYAPDGTIAAADHVDPGYTTFALPVPADGKTGDYVIYMGAIQKDNVLAPYTALPEVYVSNYVTGNNFMQKIFVRSTGDTPETFTFKPHQGPATILSTDESTVLAETETGEPIEVVVGPEGVWAINRTCYLGLTRSEKRPAILAITPQRWFEPTEKAMSLDMDRP